MFRPLRIVPFGTKFDFVGRRKAAYTLSGIIIVGSLIALGVLGLNFGIDFRGGTLIEVRTNGPANLAQMRSDLGGLGLGEVVLQEFGADDEVLIRVQRQEGVEEGELVAIETIQDALGDGVEYRRTEYVGPTVGQELIKAGTWAVILAIAGILLYISFRFEWQFGICAVAALVHDVVSTIGLFALIQHEFNLATVAALLTIAGYSINDTVVVFDRVRENLRRYKRAGMPDILNRSLNETLSRTTMTSLTTLLALAALYFFGGAVIRDFSFALIWGVLIGTYSSIFIAVPLLLYLKLRPPSAARAEGDQPDNQGDSEQMERRDPAANPAE